MLESSRLCSLSMCAVVANMFSVNGSVRIDVDVGSGSRLFSNVDVTVMYRVFLTEPTCIKGCENYFHLNTF